MPRRGQTKKNRPGTSDRGIVGVNFNCNLLNPFWRLDTPQHAPFVCWPSRVPVRGRCRRWPECPSLTLLIIPGSGSCCGVGAFSADSLGFGELGWVPVVRMGSPLSDPCLRLFAGTRYFHFHSIAPRPPPEGGAPAAPSAANTSNMQPWDLPSPKTRRDGPHSPWNSMDWVPVDHHRRHRRRYSPRAELTPGPPPPPSAWLDSVCATLTLRTKLPR